MKILVRSNPENFHKELNNLKTNTVRFLDGKDKIIIEHTETGETFTRTISDITVYKDAIIISWKDSNLSKKGE